MSQLAIEISPGTVFGKLTVLKKVPMRVIYQYNNRLERRSIFLCRCDCGNELQVRGGYLLHDKVKSCKSCSLATRPQALTYDQYSRRFFDLFIKHGAEKRGISIELTPNDVSTFHNRNCTYCNVPPPKVELSRGKHTKGYHYVYSHGIDRVDNTQGYTLTNCVPCCKHCNTAKSAMTIEEFKQWITNLYNHYINP